MDLWQPGSERERARALVADDDLPSRALLGAILERDGAAVDEVVDGTTALEQVRSHVPVADFARQPARS